MRNTWLCLIIALIISFICGTTYAQYDLGQTVPLDPGPPDLGPTGWFQSNPAVAGSGSIYLAVWVDMRDPGRSSDLYATRIASNGTILDPLGIRLTTHASVSGMPDVCWNGESFFVVYADNTGTVGTRILGLRVAPDGSVLDESPTVIGYPSSLRNPRVSWDGTGHLVVCEGWPVCPPDEYCIELWEGIHIFRVSLDGSSVDGPGLIRQSYYVRDPVIASSSSGQALVLWAEDRPGTATSADIYGAVIQDGMITLSSTIISSAMGAQEKPDCCWAGGQFMAVWTDNGAIPSCIRGRRISTAGYPLDPAELTVSFVAEKQFDPRVAWNGTNCLVTWSRAAVQSFKPLAPPDVYAGRVYLDGTMLDGSGVAICAAEDRQTKPCVAVQGNSFLVCWMDSRTAEGPTVPGFGHQIRGRRVYGTGLPAAAEFALTRSASQHKTVCSAYNGRHILVCWDEWKNGSRILLGRLFDAWTGEPYTLPFAVGVMWRENCFPAAAWNGKDFVVTWLTSNQIMAARVTSTGELLDPTGIAVANSLLPPNGTPPAIASDGNRCLIAYRYVTSIRGVFLSRDGTVSAPIAIGTSTSTSAYEVPAVCWTGQRYIVAWKQQLKTSTPTAPGGIDYTTVTAEGVVSTIKRITDTTFPYQFSLACDGQYVLLAAYGTDIRTRRLSLMGTLLDTGSPLIVPDSAGADNIRLAANGRNYVLTWLSPRIDTASSAPGWQDDMVAIRIDPGNQLVDAAPITIAGSPDTETGAALSAGPMGRAFLAWCSWEPAPYGSMRANGLYLDEWMTLPTIGEVRGLFEGARVTVPAAHVVSALFADRFYVQDGRNFGIGVKFDPAGIAPGDAVTVTGRLKNLGGEPVIEASEAAPFSHGHLVPRPVGMVSRDLGGVSPGPLFGAVENARGPYNVGLLVNVFGRVTETGSGFFVLSDGGVGVKVLFEGADLPAYGSYVKVTGVSGSYESGGTTYRLVRAAGWSRITGE